MMPTIPDLRRYLMTAYSDEDLVLLCDDYFREVYENFAAGMTKRQKIRLLLDYCQGRELLPNLAGALERDRSEQYHRRFPLIVAAPRPVSASLGRDPYQIFVSHAHEDAGFAHRLAADLRQHGWRIWIAPDSIAPGEKWVEAISRGLEECGVFVVALTPAAMTSDWVQTETNVAIELAHRHEARFIFLGVEDCRPPLLWTAFQRISFAGRYPAGLTTLLAWLDGGCVKPTAAAAGLHAAAVGQELQTRARAEIGKAIDGLAAGMAGALNDAAAIVAQREAVARARAAIQAVAQWPGQPISFLQARAGLMVAPIQPAPPFVFDTDLHAGIREAERRVNDAADMVVLAAQAEIDRLWRELDFTAALGLICQVEDLANSGQREWLGDWRARLERCVTAAETLAQAISAARQQWGGRPDGIAAAFDAVQIGLKSTVLDDTDMPESAREQAKQLNNAICLFQDPAFDCAASHARAIRVSQPSSQAQWLLGQAQRLVQELWAAALDDRSVDSWAKNQNDATINLLEHLRSLVGDGNLTDAQRARQKAALDAREKASLVESQLRDAKNLLRSGMMDADVGKIMQLLQDALDDLDSGDRTAMPQTADFQKRIADLGRELVRAQCVPGKALGYFQQGLADVARRCGQLNAFDDDRDRLLVADRQVRPLVDAREIWLTSVLDAGETALQVACKNLVDLAARLEMLVAEENWPTLVHWAIERRNELVGTLSGVLGVFHDHAQSELRASQCLAAFMSAKHGWRLVAGTGWETTQADWIATLRGTAQMAVQRVLAATGQDWKEANFYGALEVVEKLMHEAHWSAGLVDDKIMGELVAWRMRLTDCVRTEDELRHTLTAQQSQWQAGSGQAKAVIKRINEALAKLDSQADILPPATRADARALQDAASALMSKPEQFSGLPVIESAWKALGGARELIKAAAEPVLIHQIEVARAANDPQRALSLLGALGRLRDLNGTEAGWQQQAQAQVNAVVQNAPRRALAEAYLTAADKALSTETAAGLKEAAEYLKATADALASNDFSPEAQGLRRRADILAEVCIIQSAASEIAALPQDADSLPQSDDFWSQLTAALAKTRDTDAAGESWQAWAGRIEGQILEQLRGRLDKLAKRATAAQDKYDYDEALRLAHSCLKPAAQPRWREALYKAKRRLDEVKQTAGEFKTGRESFESVRGRISSRKPQTASEWKQIQGEAEYIKGWRDPYVERCLRSLRSAYDIATAWQNASEPELDKYAQELAKLLNLSWPEDMTADWPWLSQQVTLWRMKTGERIVELVQTLTAKLRDETNTFITQRDQPPTPLVDLCWQARWVWAALAFGDPTSERRGRVGVLTGVPVSDNETADLSKVRASLKDALDKAIEGLPSAIKQPGSALRGAIESAHDSKSTAEQARKAQRISVHLAIWYATSLQQPEYIALPAFRPGDVQYRPILPAQDWLTEVDDPLEILADQSQDFEHLSKRMRARRDLQNMLTRWEREYGHD